MQTTTTYKTGYGIKPEFLTTGAVLVLKTNEAVRYTLSDLLPQGFRQPKPRYKLTAPNARPLQRTLSQVRTYWKLEVAPA